MTSLAAKDEARAHADAELTVAVAATTIDCRKLRQLFAQGANPNYRNADDQPLLHILAGKGAIEAIRLAVDAGADVDGVDADGNPALAETTAEMVALALLQCGASPSIRNHAGRTPMQELQQEKPDPRYASVLNRCINLLRNGEIIESQRRKGQLSTRTWADLWPNNAFGYPGSSGHAWPNPEPSALVYLLQVMEQDGLSMPKMTLEMDGLAGQGLRHVIGWSEQAAVAWRNHCDHNGTPMTPEDWTESRAFSNLYRDQKVAALFTADYWADKPSLEGMVELFNVLPEYVFKQTGTRLQNTIGETVGQWLQKGAGKDFSARELQAFHRSLPEKMQPMVRGLRSMIIERQQREQPQRGGR